MQRFCALGHHGREPLGADLVPNGDGREQLRMANKSASTNERIGNRKWGGVPRRTTAVRDIACRLRTGVDNASSRSRSVEANFALNSSHSTETSTAGFCRGNVWRQHRGLGFCSGQTTACLFEMSCLCCAFRIDLPNDALNAR